MKKVLRSNFATVFIMFLAAALLTVAVYPEVFITFKTSFMLWNDYCVEYPPVFVLTNFFYQGGIQLWDFFGQMPYFHTFATLGLFKFPNVVTALSFYLLEPFCGNSSQLFHHVFAWGYMMTILLIRIIGIFLLLKIVTKNRIILTVGTVIFAVFFSQLGFLGGALYRNLFPLGIYFVVRFFQGLELRFLISAFLFFIVVMGNELLHGAYFYLPMHFLIISGILWRIFFNPAAKSTHLYFWNTWNWKDGGWVILVTVLVMAPYAYILKFGFPDLAFGQADSRISHPFSPQWYFQNPHFELGNPRAFLVRF